LGSANDALGGIDVIAAGQVLAGLPPASMRLAVSSAMAVAASVRSVGATFWRAISV